MAEQAVEAHEEDVEDGQDKPAAKKISGKKLVLFVIVAILLLAGGGAGAYYAGLLGMLLGEAGEHVGEEVAAEPVDIPSVFFELPEMLVNLNASGRKTNYLKITVSLELQGDDGLEQINRVMPRIVDSFQVYLRELRIEDLSGSAGLQRLREELLLRVNAAAQPVVIKDVLFKEMLVQ